VERFQQTLKNWLAAQDPQPADLAALQALLDTFTRIYNHQRPHRSLPHRATPATAYAARPKALPGDRSADSHDRVRTDKISKTGNVTLRTGGTLYHIGVGRAHAGTCVLLLVPDLHVRIINAATGELPRDLVLDPRPQLPAHRQTPTATQKPEPLINDPEPALQVRGHSDVSRHHTSAPGGVQPQDIRMACRKT